MAKAKTLRLNDQEQARLTALAVRNFPTAAGGNETALIRRLINMAWLNPAAFQLEAPEQVTPPGPGMAPATEAAPGDVGDLQRELLAQLAQERDG